MTIKPRPYSHTYCDRKVWQRSARAVDQKCTESVPKISVTRLAKG